MKCDTVRRYSVAGCKNARDGFILRGFPLVVLAPSVRKLLISGVRSARKDRKTGMVYHAHCWDLC